MNGMPVRGGSYRHCDPTFLVSAPIHAPSSTCASTWSSDARGFRAYLPAHRGTTLNKNPDPTPHRAKGGGFIAEGIHWFRPGRPAIRTYGCTEHGFRTTVQYRRPHS